MADRERLFSKQPLVVGAIAEEEAFGISMEGCDVIELRLDSLGWSEKVVNFSQKCPLPLLITARGPDEGGANHLSVEDRRMAYAALLPYADAIDIELRSFEDLADLVEAAKRAGVFVVGSFHDFKKTPPLEELQAKMGGVADIHKFATMVLSEEDLETHRALLAGEGKLSVMGMGPLGAAARPEMMSLGSILNYGFLGETPTAPDQWPAAELKRVAF